MNKSILITGASSGIGAATAKVFLKAGWQVGLLARRQAALEAVADGNEDAADRTRLGSEITEYRRGQPARSNGDEQ